MTLSNLYESRFEYLGWPDHSLHLLHLGLNGVVGASQPLHNLSTFLHPPLSDDGDDDDDDDVDDVVDDDEGDEEVNLMMIREALKSTAHTVREGLKPSYIIHWIHEHVAGRRRMNKHFCLPNL